MLGRDLLTESVHLLFGEATFEEGAGVGAGGGVSLEEHVVAAAGVVLAAEEVVEADLVEGGNRGVGRDVSADLDAGALGARHLDGGVPSDPAAVFALHGFVAGEVRLLVNGDGVDVGGRVFLGELNAVAARFVQHVQQDVACAGAALFVDEPGQGLNPFGGLLGVVVGNLRNQAVDDGVGLVELAHGVPSRLTRCCSRSLCERCPLATPHITGPLSHYWQTFASVCLGL